jgi:hypothetical protein
LHPLKKIAAIVLTGLLLFYWAGYQLLFAYWQQCAEQKLEIQLDNSEYDQSMLVSIKISAMEPAYYNESVEFQRVDGVIEVGGVVYRFVKRRFFADSIELLCIPDGAEIKMTQARNELEGWIYNFHFPPSSSKPGIHFQKICSPAALHLLFRPFNPLRACLADVAFPLPASGHEWPAERPPDPRAAIS